MATRAPRAGTTLCCVIIGHQDFVLPLDKGLKLVALLKDAVEVDREFAVRSTTYHRSAHQPSISMDVLQPEQFSNKVRPMSEED